MLEEILKQKRATIVLQWIDRILDTYPADAARFFKKEKDPIGNPVGGTLRREIQSLFDLLLDGEPMEKAQAALDAVNRMRAVQDFSPAEAAGFVFPLKDVIRAQFDNGEVRDGLAEDLVAFERRIDAMALAAFDSYSRARERIYEIRLGEIKRQTQRAAARIHRSPSTLVACEADCGDAPGGCDGKEGRGE